MKNAGISEILSGSGYNGGGRLETGNRRLRNVTHSLMGQWETMNTSEFIRPTRLTAPTGQKG
jgi:hypothetical protein